MKTVQSSLSKKHSTLIVYASICSRSKAAAVCRFVICKESWIQMVREKGRYPCETKGKENQMLNRNREKETLENGAQGNVCFQGMT
jgi:hypothetical protein